MSDEISESFCQEIIKQYEKNSLQRPVYVIQEHHATRLHWDCGFLELSKEAAKAKLTNIAKAAEILNSELK